MDEWDRLLDMGFDKQIRLIYENIIKKLDEWNELDEFRNYEGTEEPSNTN